MPIPVIKWAGGKRQLIPVLRNCIPRSYGNYYEPFFGGGALFFELLPQNAIINDSNRQLMNMYRYISSSSEEIIKYLSFYQDTYNNLQTNEEKTNFYYNMRGNFNSFVLKNISNIESASLFIFLNKAGYNGLYRVNKNGLFNVPSAHRTKLNIYDADNIQAVSKLLQNCRINCGDFEDACRTVKLKDFVFFDSPYYDTFDTYQAGGFSEADHLRLAKLFQNLSENGVYCLLTNNNCDFIKNLYKDYNIEVIPVKRMVNCDKNNRVGSEVIITNFKR